jgi:hypothetical protein
VRRHWKTVALVVTVAVVALSVVAVAYGAATRQSTGRATVRSACGVSTNNPQAFKDMQALRADHLKHVRAWYREYGSNPWSAEAQAALQNLRQERWSGRRALFQKYGAGVPQGAGPGTAGGCAGASPGSGTAQGTGNGMMGSGGGTMRGWSH